jgi:hypothetical protein
MQGGGCIVYVNTNLILMLFMSQGTITIISDKNIQIPAGQEVSLHSTASREAVGPTQPPIQWVEAGSFPRN